jgi:hypothetical protein
VIVVVANIEGKVAIMDTHVAYLNDKYMASMYDVCLPLYVFYPCIIYTCDGEYRCTNSWEDFIIWAEHP